MKKDIEIFYLTVQIIGTVFAILGISCEVANFNIAKNARNEKVGNTSPIVLVPPVLNSIAVFTMFINLNFAFKILLCILFFILHFLILSLSGAKKNTTN
ncbi:hypothetical protein [Armatimonas sp.]|uniref:hypothetical protein n=1 Tax=Armatimonas sp. TaxID=1872638 RepID=UPI003753DB48